MQIPKWLKYTSNNNNNITSIIYVIHEDKSYVEIKN